MITLHTQHAVLVQLHRNHLTTPLGATCRLRLTGGVSGVVVELDAPVQPLEHCYILTVAPDQLAAVGMHARLEVFATTQGPDEAPAFATGAFVAAPSPQ